VRLRHGFLALWAALAALAIPAASRVGRVIALDLPAPTPTESARARAALDGAFTSAGGRYLAVAVSGPAAADDGLLARLLDSLTAQAARQPSVHRVIRPLDPAWRRTAAGNETFFAVTLRPDPASPGFAAGRFRAALDSAAARTAPMYEVLVTGLPALEWDARQVSIEDARRLERAALLPAAVVLIVAFGGLVAAALPLLLGLLAITIALGAVSLLGSHVPVAVFVVPIVTMVGLGVGIDYSLLVVTRFREELRHGKAPPEAAAASVRTAGHAVLVSGLVVAIGFTTLLFTPSWETRSVGIGGLLVVGAATASATTLLPAVLALLGRRLDQPRAVAARLTRLHGHSLWSRWGGAITRHRWIALAGGLALIAVLAWPARGLELGLPRQGWFPAGTESARGAEVLARLGAGGELLPLDVVLLAPSGERVVSPGRLPGLGRLTEALRAVPGVRLVRGPTALRPGMSVLEYALLYGDLARARARLPEVFETWVAPNGRTARIQVVLEDTATVLTAMNVVRHVRGLVGQGAAGLEGLEILTGGFAAGQVDEEVELRAGLSRIALLVFGGTGAVLFLAFRSVLVPLKAVAMNACAVAAALGLVTLVFQRGVGATPFGLSGPTETTFLYVPLMTFVIAFGLGMDYEIFLLSRVKEAFDRSGDNDIATSEGLRETAGVITSAAAIMVVVFGAFAFARSLLAQTVGFGLAVAVLVDATVVRLVIVPAFMHVAGQWNWWPGRRDADRL
jgi:RND superfamily putative drug exporter